MVENIDFEIPESVKKFLDAKYGKSLIIKGPPGSGKTTFVLQLMKRYSENLKCIYYSTRMGDESLYKQFPWLKRFQKNFKLLISSKLFLAKTFSMKEEVSIHETARKFISETYKEPYVSKYFYNKFIKEEIPEISIIYDELKNNLPEKSLLIIDSIEGLSSRINIEKNILTYVIQKDIIEPSGSDVIFVSEASNTSQEDFIVDGIVELNYEINDGRIFRSMTIHKLRGIEVSRSYVPFSLNSGVLRILSPYTDNEKLNPFEIIPFKEGYFSSGIKELDEILNGGYRLGSIVNFEVEKNVPVKSLSLLRNPLFINALKQHKGINHTPSVGSSYQNLKNFLLNYIDEKTFYDYYISIDYTASRSEGINHISLAELDKDKAYDIDKRETEKFSLSKVITISWVHYDMLEYFYGSERVLKILFDMLSMKRDINANTIALTKPGQKINEEISQICDYKFKLISKGNSILLYGVKPSTKYYSLEIDYVKGFPNVTLVPVT